MLICVNPEVSTDQLEVIKNQDPPERVFRLMIFFVPVHQGQVVFSDRDFKNFCKSLWIRAGVKCCKTLFFFFLNLK